MIPRIITVRKVRNLGNFETISEEISVDLENQDTVDSVFYETIKVIDFHLNSYKKGLSYARKEA